MMIVMPNCIDCGKMLRWVRDAKDQYGICFHDGVFVWYEHNFSTLVLTQITNERQTEIINYTLEQNRQRIEKIRLENTFLYSIYPEVHDPFG